LRPTVLVIGGSDSSGGAGVGRDLRTLADFDVAGTAVITAVTAQTHTRVESIHAVPPSSIRDQIATALESNVIRAVKIGMLGTRHAVEAVASSLPSDLDAPIVLDPVLAASSGRALLDEEGRSALVNTLLPRASLITPNIPETALLLGEPIPCDSDAIAQYAQRLLDHGPRAVLVKGGHAEGDESIDVLITTHSTADHAIAGGRQIVTLRGPRLTGTIRGTGCALASAIAAGLARDMPLATACEEAKRYVASLFDGLKSR
jgi:hydroxymethylpyrimidine/phosphomethylpyrimidine kinase